jgi:hypothetical protein
MDEDKAENNNNTNIGSDNEGVIQERVTAAQRFFDHERQKTELRKTQRRASLAATTTEHVDVDDGIFFKKQTPVAVNSYKGRRASLGGELPGASGYGYDYGYTNNGDDDANQGYDCEDEIRPSSRSTARRASLSRGGGARTTEAAVSGRSRRASMSGGRAGNSSNIDDGYEPTTTSRRNGPRRASMSGGAMPRRSSNNFNVVPEPTPRQQRRMSNGVSRRRSATGGSMPVQQVTAEPFVVQHKLPVGINPDVVARMSRRMSNSNGGANNYNTNNDVSGHDDDSENYEYEDHNANTMGYGYGYGAPTRQPAMMPAYERRGSNRSSCSRSSARSRRRNSCVIRKDQPDARTQVSEIHVPSRNVPDSDMEDNDSEMSGDESIMYGYGDGANGTSGGDSGSNDVNDAPSARKNDEMLMSDSEQSTNTFNSTRRSRRNSCLIRPGQQILGMDQSFGLAASPIAGDTMLELLTKNNDDLNDPDSLLNRSGYFNSVIMDGTATTPTSNSNKEASRRNDPLAIRATSKKQASPQAIQTYATTTSSSSSVKQQVTEQPPTIKKESAAKSELAACANGPPECYMDSYTPPVIVRSTPFTSPKVQSMALTSDALFAVANQPLTESQHSQHKTPGGYNYHGNGITNNWGELGLFGGDNSSSDDDDSEGSFGASMYASQQHYEMDRYKQRPRRSASLSKTCFDINELLKEGGDKNNKKQRIPDFLPAANCGNAADYILRWFTARMRLGFTILKHNRSRWSKSQKRILCLLSDGKTLSWKPVEGSAGETSEKGKRPKLDLTKCKEVRHAWSPDPETRKALGTSVMRKRVKEGCESKSFALIFSKRTLDMTAMTADQCKVMMEGFSALCFRLQMDQLQQQQQQQQSSDCNSNDKYYCGRSTNSLGNLTDDDWVSTVYGGESTVSMTQSAASGKAVPTFSPWGF